MGRKFLGCAKKFLHAISLRFNVIPIDFSRTSKQGELNSIFNLRNGAKLQRS